jgi:hypothetical protein
LLNQDADALGVWQDANTFRKQMVFKAHSDIKMARDSAASLPVDKSDEDDIQVVKVVESHKDEILRSGNTGEYWRVSVRDCMCVHVRVRACVCVRTQINAHISMEMQYLIIWCLF